MGVPWPSWLLIELYAKPPPGPRFTKVTRIEPRKVKAAPLLQLGAGRQWRPLADRLDLT